MTGDIVILILGALMGASAAWLLVTARLEARRAELAERVAGKEREIGSLQAALGQESQKAQAFSGEITQLKTAQAELKTTLEQERKSAGEKMRLLEEARAGMSEAFKVLSSDALKSNNQSFLDLARESLQRFQQGAQTDLAARQQAIDELLKPMKTSLEKVDAAMAQIESARAAAYAGLTEQVKSLGTSQAQLQAETANLVKALRAPQVRGRWGEMQLKRVVEMAGMVAYCDFATQVSVSGEDGVLRPDMVVRLPGGKQVVVDAKCPLQAYLDAIEARDDGARAGHLRRHAQQVKDHNDKLKAKAYWSRLEQTPEFVVLFLPGEVFFSAALEQDPSLIEAGGKEVILATPTTLIAILRAVAYGWRQERIAENYQAISKLGSELYERIRVMGDHFSAVGANLDRAAKSYNDAMGSLESRVMVSARRFKQLGPPGEKEIKELARVETRARVMQGGEDALVIPGEAARGE